MTHRLAWPADHFYWAILDAPGVRRAGPIPAGLLPLLEDDVPASADDLHAVGVPLAGGRLCVCAAEAAALRAIPPGTLSLTPESLPSFLANQCLSPDQFNLLAGAFEPGPLRRRRVRRHALAAGTMALCAALVAIGLHRRASRWEAYAHDARATSQTLAAETANVPPHQLAAQAARLRGTLDALAKAAPSPDASIPLAAALKAWPASIPSKPQSITTNPTGIAISVTLEGEPAAFLDAFMPPEGWTLDEPRVNSADKVARLALQLRPRGARP